MKFCITAGYWRRCGPVVRALGLHAAAPGSNPVLTSGLDLFPVVPDSTPPRFVNSKQSSLPKQTLTALAA